MTAWEVVGYFWLVVAISFLVIVAIDWLEQHPHQDGEYSALDRADGLGRATPDA